METTAPTDFWVTHTWDLLLLAGWTLFPRLTLLFTGGPFGLWHWAGWVVCPHVLVAVLATDRYWSTNPVLCVIAWFVAFAGTVGEGHIGREARRKRRRDRCAAEAAEAAALAAEAAVAVRQRRRAEEAAAAARAAQDGAGVDGAVDARGR